MDQQLLGSVDVAAALEDLRSRTVNYDPAGAPLDGRADGHWHVDSDSTVLGHERPGPPAADGLWQSACTLVRRYEFTDPRIVRAVYRYDDDLLGRDMLLEGRFLGLRFYLGVRVTEVMDETQGNSEQAERLWGWSYQTLEGHLEQGRLSYTVIKNLASGDVRFRVSGYSRRAPISNPVIRWGFALFGRRTQVRFHQSVQRRLRDLAQAVQRGEPLPDPTVRPDGLTIAPSGAAPHPLERFSRASHHPGR